MAARLDTKQRSVRIPRDYFNKPDGLARGKGVLSVIAVAGCVVWILGIGWDPREWPRRDVRSRSLASHGELARVHASWDVQCATCHISFKPIDGSSWASKLLGDTHSSDARCQTCHAGPRHHAKQSTADAPSCAHCHQDHRGRDASLIAMSDDNCSVCHSALSGHLAAGEKTSVVETVTAFDGDLSHHAEAALFRGGPAKDAGTITFSHKVHMTKGFNLEPNGVPLRTVNDLPASDKGRYRMKGIPDSDGIQLRCDSCHRLEAAASAMPDGRAEPEPAVAPRGRGEYMVPVRFETECRACHPQAYDPNRPAMPHGKQPSEMRQILWRAYAARYLDQHPELESSVPAPRPLPPSPLPGRQDPPALRQAREMIAESVAIAEDVLFGAKKCGECHAIPARPDRPGKELASENFVVTGTIPVVWFSKAKFDHTSHRAVACKECHARAYPDHSQASDCKSDVMIPEIATCRKCHGARRETNASVSGGAGTRCTECHRYHNRDAPLEGRGGPARDAIAKLRIDEFLRGSLDRPAH